jgi:membrane fusion protein, multidrug efflux system
MKTPFPLFMLLVLGLTVTTCGDTRKTPENAAKSDKDQPATVSTSVIAQHDFVDSLEAIGTAKAREFVSLSSSVTDRIRAINFRDGQYVRQGQILVELAQAEEAADLGQARARLKQAEAQLARIQALARQGYATRSLLDEQTAARDTARGAVASLEARIQDRFIRAPFSGTVGLRTISTGLVASANTPILELTDTSVIKLDFTVPETLLAGVRAGQNVEAVAAAYPERRFSGRIEAIDPQIDPVTRAASLRALIPNPDRTLRAGMLMTVKIEQAKRTALAVPEQALVAEGDTQSVYVVNLINKTVAKHRVTIGARDNGLVEITGGIAGGSTIVTDGIVKLRDGGKIAIAGRPGPDLAASSDLRADSTAKAAIIQ